MKINFRKINYFRIKYWCAICWMNSDGAHCYLCFANFFGQYYTFIINIYLGKQKKVTLNIKQSIKILQTVSLFCVVNNNCTCREGPPITENCITTFINVV